MYVAALLCSGLLRGAALRCDALLGIHDEAWFWGTRA
jgi:hypothetical protein